ncbi:MAG TPA: hypothetical protein VFE50_05475 [Cyclobacteriaceae bacterium]|nr:hypothetical protein [Cyclobacteriaceae bacterium]
MTCPNCSKESADDAIMCPDCRYPFTASAETKARFIAAQVTKTSDIGDSKEALKRAQWILMGIGALTILSAVLKSDSALAMGIDVSLGVISSCSGCS